LGATREAMPWLGRNEKVWRPYPEVEMYFTEGSIDYNDPHYKDDWTK
jgi:hypothetical protein